MEIGKPSNVCPKCNSENIKVVDYLGIKCLVCNNCGFDERYYYEIYPEQRTSQKEKGRFNPYKAGGKRRTVNK